MIFAAYELSEALQKDPADRLSVAIARLLAAPVVAIDRRIVAWRLGRPAAARARKIARW
jgi:PIN domain nuclease of toxin-antitoxin system